MIRIEPRLMKPVRKNLKNVQGGGLKIDRALLIFMAQSRLERLGPSDVINSNEVHLKENELESLRKSLSIFGGRCFGLESHNGQQTAIASLEDWRAFVSKQAFDKADKILRALNTKKGSNFSEFWYSNQKEDVIIEVDKSLSQTVEWQGVKAKSAGATSAGATSAGAKIEPVYEKSLKTIFAEWRQLLPKKLNREMFLTSILLLCLLALTFFTLDSSGLEQRESLNVLNGDHDPPLLEEQILIPTGAKPKIPWQFDTQPKTRGGF